MKFMSFNSFSFWIVFPIIFGFYSLIQPITEFKYLGNIVKY